MHMTIDELNGLDRAAFVNALGWVFEDSPWVAERTWEGRPFANRDALHQAMTDEFMHASREEQLALLRAHPDLGARRRMSAASQSEQSSAGLDRLAAEEFDDLLAQNATYRAKFGFPFLFAVKGAGSRDILEALRRRLERTQEEEFHEAIAQVCRIARFRLEEIIR